MKFQACFGHASFMKMAGMNSLPSDDTISDALGMDVVGLFRWSGANGVFCLFACSSKGCRERFSDDNSSGFFLLAITGTELSKIGVVGLAPVVSSKKPSPPNIPPSGEENPGLILLSDDEAGIVLWSGVVINPCLLVFDTILNVLWLELRGVAALSETGVALKLDFSLKLKVLWFSVLLVGAFSAWCGRLVVSGGRDLGWIIGIDES